MRPAPFGRSRQAGVANIAAPAFLHKIFIRDDPAMQRRLAYASLLLLTSQLVAPALLAQSASGATPAPPQTSTTATSPDGQATPQSQTPTGQDGQAADEPVEISAPGVDATAGNEIVVVGRNIPNTIRATPQIVSVLSAADIARTGEGDIAGALTRVTGSGPPF